MYPKSPESPPRDCFGEEKEAIYRCTPCSLAMEEANRSAAAQAVDTVEGFAAARVGTLTPAASPVPSSSSLMPTNCGMISRMHAKARWLIRMLAWVRATLDDVEDMDITDESVRVWLQELQEVADATEDLLDEIPHETLRLGFVGDGGWTAGGITELQRQRKRTSEMDRFHDQRMEDIVSRFMKIKKPEQALKLDCRKEQVHAESISARWTTNSLPSDSYTRMEHLRVLDLGGAHLHHLPESITRLKHLRYLCISGFFKELPEFVGSIYHLQTLYLEGEPKLPNSMSNLHKLRHLILSSSDIEYPVGIGMLTDLQTAPGFRVSPEHNHAKLGELKDMNSIRGRFAIKGLESLADVNEAKKACLDKKRNISSLHLEWRLRAASSYIDNELEELTLKYLYNWKSWCGAQEGDCPKLKKLSITECENLESLSLINLGAVEDISISSCRKLRCMPGNSLELSHLQRAKTIIIKNIYKVLSIEAHLFPAPPLDDKPHLYMEDVGQGEAECILGICSHICRLTVKRCSNLTSLPLGNQSILKHVEISDCPELRITSVSPQLWQLPSLQRIHVHRIHGAVSLTVFEKSHLKFTNVDQLEASFWLKEFSHMIHRLIISGCTNLTSLPWTDLINLEYLRISECPLFQLLEAEQLPPTLQVLCIYGNPYDREQCSQHQHFQIFKQVQQCSNKQGGDRRLYLVFRNVLDASAALKFCSLNFTEVDTLDIEWDCCSNDWSNDKYGITQEVLSNLYSFCISSKKLVIRGYTGSGFSGWYAKFFSKKLRSDFLQSRLSSVSLLQCSKCEILPELSQLPFLKELYVEGASSLKSVVLDYLFPYDQMSERERQATYTRIAFPHLQKLEFHDMPVWKEWLGTKEAST
ncbi:hypothetical protein Taro_045577 [Colocasia esculenta]|uniref:Rx N-terminal domain-containing protein n=1 Tax=Colocasia esculenta TaxID=4460 RepID=A0A843WWX6_COLES|nr:hypothetical protein [Colocasia esculenta]